MEKEIEKIAKVIKPLLCRAHGCFFNDKDVMESPYCVYNFKCDWIQKWTANVAQALIDAGLRFKKETKGQKTPERRFTLEELRQIDLANKLEDDYDRDT
ncbi:MAG: hypothetical protein PHG35_02160 [Dehalococcoidales bacterium]|nr:hypothetical protein [Dehalococcoidales bacterium]